MPSAAAMNQPPEDSSNPRPRRPPPTVPTGSSNPCPPSPRPSGSRADTSAPPTSQVRGEGAQHAHLPPHKPGPRQRGAGAQLPRQPTPPTSPSPSCIGQTNFKLQVCTLGKDVVITKKLITIVLHSALRCQRSPPRASGRRRPGCCCCCCTLLSGVNTGTQPTMCVQPATAWSSLVTAKAI
jgi:hypothetical protein